MGRVALEITHSDAGLMMAMYGPVCLALWRTKPTPSAFQIQEAHLARAVARDPGKVAFLCVVAPSAEPPDDAERAASAAMISKHGSNLAAVACVIEGSGFRAAITRTVLSGIMLLTRTRSPVRLFESVEHAAPWLGERVGQMSVLNLAAEVELARRRWRDSAA